MIVFRNTKNTPLTTEEVDNNFAELDAKITSGLVNGAPSDAVTMSDLENVKNEIKEYILDEQTHNQYEIRLQAVETRINNNELGYDDTQIKERLSALENNAGSGTSYDDTEIKNRLVALEDKTDNDTIYDDSEIKTRLQELENKTDNDTIYDDSDIKARLEVLENKTDNDTLYDDTQIKERLTALESKTDNDTIYDDSEIRGEVETLKNQIVALQETLNGLNADDTEY